MVVAGSGWSAAQVAQGLRRRTEQRSNGNYDDITGRDSVVASEEFPGEISSKVCGSGAEAACLKRWSRLG